VRPDERSLAGAVKSMLGWAGDDATFANPTRGMSIARGGLDTVLADLGAYTPYVLDEAGEDLRDAKLDVVAPVFFLGDHLGLDEPTRTQLTSLGATSVRVGPVSVHADDAITITSNELDRREAP
jgi:tRNA pseudouridine-54 N-methylase